MQADTAHIRVSHVLVCLDGHISLFGYWRIPSAKHHSCAGLWEAIRDTDNEINTEEQTKERAVCIQYKCFNSQRTSRKGGKGKTHARKRQCCTCLGVFPMVLFILF